MRWSNSALDSECPTAPSTAASRWPPEIQADRSPAAGLGLNVSLRDPHITEALRTSLPHSCASVSAASERGVAGTWPLFLSTRLNNPLRIRPDLLLAATIPAD